MYDVPMHGMCYSQEELLRRKLNEFILLPEKPLYSSLMSPWAADGPDEEVFACESRLPPFMGRKGRQQNR